MSKRIEYIDIARGIGILLVVLGHNDFAYVSAFAYKVIYSFHMPLFFFLSGYFLNTSLPFFDFFKKRFNSLLKPYFFTIFLIYFFYVSFDTMGFETALRRIVKSIYGSGLYIDWVQLWFLPHLFAVSLYAFLLFAIFGRWNNHYTRWAALLLTLGVSSLFLQSFYPFSLSVLGKSYELFGLPFSLDLVLLRLLLYPGKRDSAGDAVPGARPRVRPPAGRWRPWPVRLPGPPPARTAAREAEMWGAGFAAAAHRRGRDNRSGITAAPAPL